MVEAVEKINNIERRVKVVVSVAPLQNEITQRFQQLTKTARVQGFRPGKVPIRIIEQQYGPDIKSEVYSKAIEAKFGEFVQKNNLKVAGMPDIEHEPLAKVNKDFEFTATFEIFPEIKDIDAKKIKITEYVSEVKESDIIKTIGVISAQKASFKKVDRLSKLGDKISIKMESFIGDEKIEATGDQTIDFTLGDTKRIKAIDDQLVGIKTGDSKEFEVKYPKDHEPEQLAGKTVKYQIKMLEVNEVILPKVDTEFAKSLGVKDGNVKTMHEEIKASLLQEVDKRIKSSLKKQVFAELVKSNNADLPKSLVSMEANRIMQMMYQNLKQQGSDVKDLTIEPAMFEERAKETCKLRMILAKVVEANKLEATDEQIKSKVQEFALNYDDPDKAVKWFYEDSKRLGEPASLATEDNVVGWILKHCKKAIKKISVDELMELQPNG
ncbi:MAG: trigger factor [Methylophilaceae bacterium]